MPEPAQARISSSPAVLVFFQAGDSSIIDDFSPLVAPAAVNYLPNPDLVDIARDHAIHQLARILTGDQILVERRDVDKGSSVADGIVLVLVMHFIDTDCVISRPLTIIQALTQRKSSLVECSSNGQGGVLGWLISFVCRRESSRMDYKQCCRCTAMECELFTDSKSRRCLADKIQTSRYNELSCQDRPNHDITLERHSSLERASQRPLVRSRCSLAAFNTVTVRILAIFTSQPLSHLPESWYAV